MGGKGREGEERGWMKEDRGTGVGCSLKRGRCRWIRCHGTGGAAKYTPPARCTCVHLRKGRGSGRRMMHITVCRPDRDGRDGGGALHAKGGGSKSHICNKNNGSRGGEKDDTGVLPG